MFFENIINIYNLSIEHDRFSRGNAEECKI